MSEALERARQILADNDAALADASRNVDNARSFYAALVTRQTALRRDVAGLEIQERADARLAGLPQFPGWYSCPAEPEWVYRLRADGSWAIYDTWQITEPEDVPEDVTLLVSEVDSTVAGVIYDRLQPKLMADSFAGRPEPEQDSYQDGYRSGFERGKGQALQWLSEVVRDEPLRPDEALAKIQREAQERLYFLLDEAGYLPANVEAAEIRRAVGL